MKKQYDYHSLFYYLVLSPLQGLKSVNGEALSEQLRVEGDRPHFSVAYDPRPSFDYEYERNKYLESRSRLIISNLETDDMESGRVILLSENGNDVTIYKKAVDYIFREEAEEALRELTELLEKFYTVTQEERSRLQEIDYNKSGRHPNHYEVNDLR